MPDPFTCGQSPNLIFEKMNPSVTRQGFGVVAQEVSAAGISKVITISYLGGEIFE